MAKGKRTYRYTGRRRRGGTRTSMPIMGAITAAALGAGILTTRTYPHNAMEYLGSGGYVDAGKSALEALKKPQTYGAMAVPLTIWIIGRIFLGKRRLTKRISIF